MSRSRMFPLALLFWCAVSGCTSLAEKGGRILDGSAFDETVLETYRSSGSPEKRLRKIRARGSEKALLTLDGWPGLKFYLALEDGTGAARNIDSVSCYFLASGLSGWNEWTMELSGTGTFLTENGNCELVLDRVEAVGISWGRLRREDGRLTGEEALTVLRNREERIGALAAWMTDNSGAKVFNNLKDFENHWKPILLPEISAKKKRPSGFTKRGAEMVKAEDVLWNKSYTAEHFPPDIGMLRDSGALLRDWEEALPWIYLFYHWDDILDQISGTSYYGRTGG